MADTARGRISVTPVVTIAADDDADSVDAIHHSVNRTLGGKLEYAAADATEKWYYKRTIDVNTGADELISGNFTSGGSIAQTDKVKFLYVENTGTTDGTTSTTADLYLTFDQGEGNTQTDSLIVSAGESFICKPRDSQVGHIYGDTSSGTVRCFVLAIIDDI